jgi:hypothetical protein
MLRWDWYWFHKKRTEASYIEFVFLHSVGTAGHVVYSGASGVRNIDTIFHGRVGPVQFP